MHEWALAEAVLSAAENTAKAEKLKSVDEVEVRLGELQRIDRGAFKFALKEIRKSGYKILSRARIHLAKEQAEFTCKACGLKIKLGDIRKKTGADEAEFIHFLPEMAHAFLKCAKCSSPDFDITAGRGVFIKSIKGVKNEH